MLPEPDFELLQLVHAGPGSVVALIGGGGKTTLMERLAATASATGSRVLMTTTTRIRSPQNIPLIVTADLSRAEEQLRAAWEKSSVVALATSVGEGRKLHGVSPATLCALADRFPEAVIVCEADGSAGKPLKIHAEHEPVIPCCSTTVAIVGGLDAMGLPVDGDVIHRLERLDRSWSGLQTVTPALVAHLLSSAADGAPEGTRTVFILNKADTSEREAAAELVRENLTRLRPAVRVIVTQRGALLPSTVHRVRGEVLGNA